MPHILHPSPNANARPSGAKGDIRHLILHYTDMPSLDASLAIMCDPKAEVSAHYCIDENGTIYQLMDESKRAWHAGISQWHGDVGLNDSSIGIELQNPGHSHGYRSFPDVQIEALIGLCQGILSRHLITAEHVLAHSDIAPTRKQDPGHLFPWRELAEAGIGLFPKPTANGNAQATDLAQYGYDISDIDAAIIAFQRHFLPARMGEPFSGPESAMLDALLHAKS